LSPFSALEFGHLRGLMHMCPIRLHRHYERTCRACGYTWVVTRGEAEEDPPSIDRFEALGETGMAGRVEGSEAEAIHQVNAEEDARLEAYEEIRRCPSCGVDDFTDRPVKGSEAAQHRGEPDQAAEGSPPLGTLSPDGTKFWSGAAWVSATAEDGSRWDGTHWVIPEA
jgi:rubredoxin